MNTYPDTSFLCSLYRRQEHTAAAIAFRHTLKQPLHASPLLEFEFRQAIRLQVWLHGQDKSKGYGQHEADQMLADWEADLSSGIVQIVAVDHDAVLRMAEFLSSSHAVKGGHRTMDILHVATAKHLAVRDFLTFDARQRKLARAIGLRTPL